MKSIKNMVVLQYRSELVMKNIDGFVNGYKIKHESVSGYGESAEIDGVNY